MTLQLLSAYLPYSLDFIFEKSGRIITMQSCFDNGSLHITDCNDGDSYDLSIWKFKPILRPLSQLKETIVHDGREFVPYEELCWDSGETLKDVIVDKDFQNLSFEDAQILLSWHFNIFNLPESDYITKQDTA